MRAVFLPIRKAVSHASRIPPDRLTLLLLGALIILGLITFLSSTLSLLATGENATLGRVLLTQLGFGVGVGIGLLMLASRLPLRWVRSTAPFFFFLALLLEILTFLPGIGIEINGARRWINLGFTTLQTSEVMKYAAFLAAAWVLSLPKRVPWHQRLTLLAIVLVPASLLLVIQRDTSNLVITILTVGTMAFVAGLPWRFIAWGLLGAVVGFLLLVVARPYIWTRLAVFLGLIDDPLGASYQVETAKIAVGSGGLWGKGVGEGIAKFSGLPQPLNDSIFATYAEETGFVGSLLLITLFMVLGARLLWLGYRLLPREAFGGLLLIGFATLLNMQALWNIGAMVGAFPLSGMTLPFFSQGATSLLLLLFASGVVLQATRFRV